MFQNKTDILLFLLYIGILIFAEKITDHHHAYNRHTQNYTTCNGTAKVWRSASKNLSYISIFTCRILKTLRSIVLMITQKKLSNKYLVYEAKWNYVKMNRDCKCKSLLYYFFFISVANASVILI
jgi:hypothetical protein